MSEQHILPEKISLRARLFTLLETTSNVNRQARVLNMAMVLLIVGNVIAVILETEPGLERDYGLWFDAFEAFSITIFTVEYILRLWVCAERMGPQADQTMQTRLRYIFSFPALVDLAAILPAYLGMWLSIDLRILRTLRLLRLLKLTRYSPALEIFAAVLHGQRRSLVAAGVVIMAMLVFASSIVYLLEHEGQPDSFGSIPDAMWWAMATLSTVGYGDVTPHTPFGKMFGGVVMIIGIAMFALPTGIMATGFATELKKRDFVISWGLVAKVPLFSRLDAPTISEIVAVLTPKLVPSRYVIVHQGEAANDMFFIVSGEVEVFTSQGVVKLKDGDFFGEIALLEKTNRTATVMAGTECHLLVLNKTDFSRLLTQHDSIRRELEKVMAARIG